MPEITIQVIAGASTAARDQLREQVERLEAQHKRIRGIRYPGWAASDLGITPDPNIANAGTYRGHRAAQSTEPSNTVVIVVED